MNPHETRRHTEASLEYLDALDAQDLDALDRLWAEAETDPELTRIFLEISQGVLEEEGLRPQWGEYQEAVLGALQKHLPSAFERAPLPPLTVGDVATKLASNDAIFRRLAPADRLANAELQKDATVLPEQLGAKALLELTGRLLVAASAKYWQEFQQVAVLASMSRAQAGAKAAARSAGKGSAPSRKNPPSATPLSKKPRAGSEN